MNKKLLAFVVAGLVIPAVAFAAEPGLSGSCCGALCQLCCSVFGTCPFCP